MLIKRIKMQSDINFFREQYKIQKKLENFVNSRVLKRPKTKKWQVAVTFVILPFLLFLLVYGFFLLKLNLFPKLLICAFSLYMLFDLYLRICFICSVKCYQHYAKEEIRRRCKCIPSCSEYAILCLKKIFPLPLALKKIKKRLFVTCDGSDFKIDFPTKKMERRFESEIY